MEDVTLKIKDILQKVSPINLHITSTNFGRQSPKVGKFYYLKMVTLGDIYDRYDVVENGRL